MLHTVRHLEARDEDLPVLAPGDKEREAEHGVAKRGSTRVAYLHLSR